MILADKIMQERKKKGWSQEELAERLEVSRQSVSKWEGGLSVPDIDKIIAMSEIFGVSTDYLLKSEADPPKTAEEVHEKTENEHTEGAAPLRRVTRLDACTYMDHVDDVSWRIALGVMLCIFSPIALILLGGLAGLGLLPLSEEIAGGVGLFLLLGMVGIAVSLFVFNGMQLSKYEYLEKEDFFLESDAESVTRGRASAYEKKHRILVTAGVSFCICGAAALVVPTAITQTDLVALFGTAALLLFVGIGVWMIVWTSYIWGSYERLLGTGDFSHGKKVKSDVISTVYWSVVTALYLGISFLTKAWNITWIIWVLAAVLSPIVELFSHGIKKT